MKTEEIKNILISLNKLTEKEIKIMIYILFYLYAEPGYSDIDANDIAKGTKIDIKIVKGVLSSLIKKGFIFIYENSSNYKIIHLCNDKFHLHPNIEWQKECTCENCKTIKNN